MSACPTIRSSTCCPTDNANTYGYKVGDNTTPEPPVITCPDDFNAWTTDDEYEVPDFTGSIEICAYCQEREDLIITQEPPAGTIVTAFGSVTIIITVTDTYGQTATCSFVITINEPPGNGGGGGGSVTVPTIPPWVYTPFLFAYWSANDTLCNPDVIDEDFPCFFRSDLSAFLGNASPNHLTNAGGGLYSALSPLGSFPSSPGPIFNRGSFFSNNIANGYFYHADNAALRLLNTDFTIRLWFRLASMNDGATWPLVGKWDTLGYRLKLRRIGSEYRLLPELRNSTTTLDTIYTLINLNEWIHAVMTFKASTGKLSLYINGLPVGSITSAGFALGGEASQFRIGTLSTPSSSCPIAYWTLDTTGWLDSMEGADLTASGTVNSIAGKIGNGAEFPVTTGGKLLFTEDSLGALKLLNTDFTVRFWVRVPSSPSNPNQIIGRRAAGAGWAARVTGPTAPFDLDFIIGGTTVTSTALLSVATWYHVVWRYRVSDGLLECFVDGIAASGAGGMTVTDVSTTFYIGIESPAAGPLNLDEVGIWDRRFSDAEIIADYNSGTGTGFPGCYNASAYHDEIGIWRQTWNDARVADDYAIMQPFLT